MTASRLKEMEEGVESGEAREDERGFGHEFLRALPPVTVHSFAAGAFAVDADCGFGEDRFHGDAPDGLKMWNRVSSC